jgi:hypothetical protein
MTKVIIPFKATQTANGTGFPGANELVTLFDSTVAFQPKCLPHQQVYWFTYSIAPSTNTTGNGVTGQWSADGGLNWNSFYTSTTNEPVGDSTTFTDEVFIGNYQDVRFLFQNGALAQATKFDVAMSLDDQRDSAGL